MIGETVIDEFRCVITHVEDGIAHFEAILPSGKKHSGKYSEAELFDLGIQRHLPFICRTIVINNGKIRLRFDPIRDRLEIPEKEFVGAHV